MPKSYHHHNNPKPVFKKEKNAIFLLLIKIYSSSLLENCLIKSHFPAKSISISNETDFCDFQTLCSVHCKITCETVRHIKNEFFRYKTELATRRSNSNPLAFKNISNYDGGQHSCFVPTCCCLVT